MRTVRRATAAASVLAAITAAGFAGGTTPAPAGAGAGQERPNVVVVMTDDQTQEEMRFLDRTRRLIGDEGATFPTSVVNWPMCCPSRATFLTGQYAHNHGVLGNLPPIGGFDELDLPRTLPVWLQRSGYYTAHIGKFLNGYEQSPVGVPPGWSEWHGSKLTYEYYGYELFEGRATHSYGSPDEDPDDPAQPETYSTDVYTDKAVDVIARRAPSTEPFFLSVAYLAPHRDYADGNSERGRCEDTAKPASRHIGALGELPQPRTPSFNEADVSDKPIEISERLPFSPADVAVAARNYRCRAESLLAVDEGVERIVDELRAAGELDDTLLVFTSDNGYFHGEHRILSGKGRVYEEAIRVPLMIRGPGIPAGTRVDEMTINADLAATIVDAAGAKPDLPLDGRSMLPLARNPDRLHGRALLIEQQTAEGVQRRRLYEAVRTPRYVYSENATGEIELYDLEQDPYELSNLHGEAAYAEAEAALADRLAALVDCRGKSCTREPALNLKLPRGAHMRGRRCVRPARFVAKVRGRDREGLVGAQFMVDGRRAGIVRRRPYRRRLGRGALRRDRRPEISVDAELVDGRVLTLHKRVRVCR